MGYRITQIFLYSLSSKIIPSQSLCLLDPTLQSDFLSDFIHDIMSYGPRLFDFRLLIWDLAVPMSSNLQIFVLTLLSMSTDHISSNFTAQALSLGLIQNL